MKNRFLKNKIEKIESDINFYLDNLPKENEKVKKAFMPEFKELCQAYRIKTKNKS